MTLQMIYDWIIENFSYFKKADASWQITFKNSIRHNLSLNKCFKKIARQKEEPGKGGFWTLDPEFERQLNESNSQSSPDQAKSSSFFNLSLNKRRRNGKSKTDSGEKKSALQKSLSTGTSEPEFHFSSSQVFDSEHTLKVMQEEHKKPDALETTDRAPQGCVFYETSGLQFYNGSVNGTVQNGSRAMFDTGDLDASSDSHHVSSLLLRADANWATTSSSNFHQQAQVQQHSYQYSNGDGGRMVNHNEIYQSTNGLNCYGGDLLPSHVSDKSGGYFTRSSSGHNQHHHHQTHHSYLQIGLENQHQNSYHGLASQHNDHVALSKT